MPLQTHVPALQPYTAPKHLYNLRPLADAYVHQPHRAHAPGVPAGDEAPGTDHHVHRRVRVVDGAEQSLGEAHLPVDLKVDWVDLGDQLVERRRVPHIDDAERRVVRDAQVQFAFSRRQIHDVQPSLSVEHGDRTAQA